MIEVDQSLFIQILNFLIFLLILNYLVFKPVVRVLEERRERIDGKLEKAQTMEAEIQKKLEQYEARIREARTRAAQEKEKLRREGESISKEIVEKARTELARDIPIIRDQVAGETARVRQELEKTTQNMARDIACRILGREIS
jgi:F-type H+-transporting ATPase subunit b